MQSSSRPYRPRPGVVTERNDRGQALEGGQRVAVTIAGRRIEPFGRHPRVTADQDHRGHAFSLGKHRDSGRGIGRLLAEAVQVKAAPDRCEKLVPQRSLERSVVQIEPVFVEERAHRQPLQKAGASEEAPRPAVESARGVAVNPGTPEPAIKPAVCGRSISSRHTRTCIFRDASPTMTIVSMRSQASCAVTPCPRWWTKPADYRSARSCRASAKNIRPAAAGVRRCPAN